MRTVLVCTALLGFLAVPVNAFAQSTVSVTAPMDENFGRYGESVLDMRNRIVKFERKSDEEVKAPDTVGLMDYVEEGLVDWQHRYPADPWVLDSMTRLLKAYERAGATANLHATELRDCLLAAYPASPQAQVFLGLADPAQSKVVAPVIAAAPIPAPAPVAVAPAPVAVAPAPVAHPAPAPAPGPAGAAIVSGEVVDATTGAPIVGAIVLVAPNHESSDLSTAAFATTGNDGSFSIAGVALGGAYSVGPISLSHAEYFIVEPPHGSAYAPYHGVVDAANGKAVAGIIRLGAR